MRITIEKVTTGSELREVAELADKIWHECFVGIISTGQIDYMVEKFQSYEAMTKQTAEQGYSYFAVREDDELCGYFAVKPEEDERFFLSKLYLRSDKRGRGIASMMLKRVFEEARSCEKKKVYLTVNKHNDHAIEVYKKTGFVIAAEAVTDIGNGFVMDDYIFEYVL
ncbi:MAG: GNAT family N-acetyltransferase [Ruminococcus sp.]|uniref:GNAT family N-acetyltransferase n=1 Tax=Ruminococcus sp. TaxID=41978 RepID=UPI0025F3A7A7|nr:GNAT family N-acetyltransferase [Ruminococcus sp.]MCR4794299.1 GNAT family N-acetyltransferase [Ruminococcus sp.]